MAQAAQQSFSDILNFAPTEVNRPKSLPAGSYVTILQGLPLQDKSSLKQTPFYEFTHKFVSAGDDVGQDELNEALTNVETGEKRNLQDITMKNRYYITKDAIWRLDEFFEHCAIELDGNVSRTEMAEATPGHTIGIVIRHVPTQDGQSTRAEIARTFAVE